MSKNIKDLLAGHSPSAVAGTGMGASSSLEANGGVEELSLKVGTHYKVECFRGGNSIWVEEFDNIVVTAGRNHILERVISGTRDSTLGNGEGYNDGRTAPPVWTANTAVSVGDVCQPTGSNFNGCIYICTTAGTTHSSTEPTWSTTAGAAIATDGNAVWYEASPWYVSLTSAASSATSFSAADTMASHSGWSESSNYSGTTRIKFVPSAPNAGSSSNTSNTADFTISGSDTIDGAFLTDHPTKGGAVGLLYGGGTFTQRVVVSGDTLKVTVTTSVTST